MCSRFLFVKVKEKKIPNPCESGKSKRRLQTQVRVEKVKKNPKLRWEWRVRRQLRRCCNMGNSAIGWCTHFFFLSFLLFVWVIIYFFRWSTMRTRLGLPPRKRRRCGREWARSWAATTLWWTWRKTCDPGFIVYCHHHYCQTQMY